MVETYHFAYPTYAYDEVVDRINNRFDNFDEKYKKYDIGYVSDHATLFELVELWEGEDNQVMKASLIIGMICMVLNADGEPCV